MAPDPGAGPDAQAGEDGSAEQASAANAAESSAAAAAPEKAKKRKRSFWRDLVVIVVAALVLVILLKAFVVQVFSIPSGSMENTLMPGDRILVSKVVYDFRPIERGDVVVFSGAGSWDPSPPPYRGNAFVGFLDRITADAENLVGIAGPSTDYVKRVIGVPGDHVACCNSKGQVTVNGVPLSESSYIYPGDAPSNLTFSIIVPKGRLWVMGDNRGDSDDSRYRTNDVGGGTIPESAVVGRAFLVIWPLSRISDLPIPNTFKQAGLTAAAAVATASTSPVPPVTAAGGTGLAGATLLAWRRRRSGRRGSDATCPRGRSWHA
jgi:signal peptidase I